MPTFGFFCGLPFARPYGRDPTPDEVELAERLAQDHVLQGSLCTGPPYYAIASPWFAAWRDFVAGCGPRPGPIANATLLAHSFDARLRWVNGVDWCTLHELYGGGPALRRDVPELFPLPSPCPDLPDVTQDLECFVNYASSLLTAQCRVLEADLAVELARLERGPWAGGLYKKAKATAARKRFSEVVTAAKGGEALRAALQSLRASGEADSIEVLDILVFALCGREEALTVFSCLLQTLHESDRHGLEMWLEQMDAMGLEAFLPGTTFSGPIGECVRGLIEDEIRVLQGYAQKTEENEDPAARLWRLSLAALEAGDDAMLADLVAAAQAVGIDASMVEVAQEELRRRRGTGGGRGTPRATRPSAGRNAAPPSSRRYSGASSDSGDSGTDSDTGRGAPERGEWRRTSRQEGASEEERFRGWERRDREWRRQQEERARSEEWARAEERAREEERARAEERQARERRRRQAEEERERVRRQEHYRRAQEEHRWAEERRRRAEEQRRRAEEPDRRDRPRVNYDTLRGPQLGDGVAAALRTLGLPTDSLPPLAEVRTAYKKACLREHPDKHPGCQEEAKANFLKVKEAFDLLAPKVR